MDNHAKIRSGCNFILPTRPTWRDQDQVRCCSAEIGMGSIVCVTVRSLQFQYRHPDTYILEPQFGLQTSLVYICGTFSSIIHYSVRLLNSLIVTPPNNYFCTLGAKATLFSINAILPCRISQVGTPYVTAVSTLIITRLVVLVAHLISPFTLVFRSKTPRPAHTPSVAHRRRVDMKGKKNTKEQKSLNQFGMKYSV